ncbi:hypothetical protein [uncultured Salipiger sp.]|uniref:hypothetical protein n=1 Tax=uncultured Salipiger sp. TaxID=499810 RepID=UPI0025922FAF|nr:hypothetical protein [uncultured Salipiger sp.]
MALVRGFQKPSQISLSGARMPRTGFRTKTKIPLSEAEATALGQMKTLRASGESFSARSAASARISAVVIEVPEASTM